MISHRITKYNPSKRNSDGAYLDHSEWTSISDIGIPKYNCPTYEEYEVIEDAYIKAIVLILKEKAIDRLTIKDLELYHSKQCFDGFIKDGRLQNLSIDFDSEIKSLSDGVELTIKEIENITITPDKILSPGLNLTKPKSKLSLTEISADSYPIYEISITEPESVLMVKRPLKSLETPVVVPWIIIEAPGRPVPVSESITVPVTEFWANIIPEKNNEAINKNFFIYELF